MKPTNQIGARAAGFSLIEMLIALTVLGLLIGSVTMIGKQNEHTYRTGALAAHLEAQAAMTMEQLVAELRIAGRDSLAPDPVLGVGLDAISYLQATGISSGHVQWSPTHRLAFEYEQGEIDDGLDNNRNGLVDEGRLVVTVNPGGLNERRRVLCRWVREFAEGETENGLDDNGNGLVDEGGFWVERNGETLVLRLTLERLDGDGRAMIRTAKTSARMRN